MNREQDFFLQFGETGTSFFTGVVEDRDDPAMMGRVRVRIFGIHPMDRTEVPTHTLPWATVILPTTEAAMSGIGSGAPKIIEGTWVVGFFRDGVSCQDPIVMGCVLTNSAPKWTGPSSLPEPEDLRILVNKSGLGKKTSTAEEKNKRNEELKSDIKNPSGAVSTALKTAITTKLEELGIKTLEDFPNMFEDLPKFTEVVDKLKASVTESVLKTAIPKVSEKFELPSLTDLKPIQDKVRSEVSIQIDHFVKDYFMNLKKQV